MGRHKIQPYTPGQTEISRNRTDVVNLNTGNPRNGLHSICIQSKSQPREIVMEKKENFAIQSFWKEALKEDSLLWWIVINSRLA